MLRPILDQLDEQLRLRPPSWACWRSSGAHLEFIQLLSLLIADEMEWPNNRFIPGDALDAVLYPHSGGDGGELMHIFDLIKRRVGVQLWGVLDRNYITPATYGDFVERCWAWVESSTWARDFGKNGEERGEKTLKFILEKVA
jgi:hypothetical protein